MTAAAPRLVVAALAGGLGVAFAAYGAHGLPADLAERLRSAYHAGTEIELAHAGPLVALALQAPRHRMSFWAMAAGVFLFSFSLYALALMGARPIAIVTPIGGLALLGAWVALGVESVSKRT